MANHRWWYWKDQGTIQIQPLVLSRGRHCGAWFIVSIWPLLQATVSLCCNFLISQNVPPASLTKFSQDVSEIYIYFSLLECSVLHLWNLAWEIIFLPVQIFLPQIVWWDQNGLNDGYSSPAALNPIGGPHLIHWSTVAKFMSFFAIPLSHYYISFPAEEHRAFPMTK